MCPDGNKMFCGNSVVLGSALSVSLTAGADGSTVGRETNRYLEYVSTRMGVQHCLFRAEGSLMWLITSSPNDCQVPLENDTHPGSALERESPRLWAPAELLTTVCRCNTHTMRKWQMESHLANLTTGACATGDALWWRVSEAQMCSLWKKCHRPLSHGF